MKKPIAVAITDTHLSDSTVELNKSIYTQAFELCLKLGLNEVEHLGDVFQSRKSQSQAVLTAYQEILDLAHDNGVTINQVVGNHDKTDYSSVDSFLDPFQHHPAMNLIRDYDNHAVVIEGIEELIGKCYMSFLTDEQYIDVVQRYTPSNTEFYSKSILFTHIGIQGAVMNNGTKPETKITPNLFKAYNLVLCGHYHDPQQFDHIEYIGAAMQHNFGEGTQKGATVIYDDLSTELVPFVFPQYLKYEVDVKSMTTKDIDDLKKEKQSSQDHIRVILKGAEKDLKAFNSNSLREIGISVQLQQEEIKIEELEARIEPFDSKSLAEEFEVFCKKNKLNHKEGLKYFNQIVNS